MSSKEEYLEALRQMQQIEREQAAFFRSVAAQIEDAEIRGLFEQLSDEEDEHEEGLHEEESQT